MALLFREHLKEGAQKSNEGAQESKGGAQASKGGAAPRYVALANSLDCMHDRIFLKICSEKFLFELISKNEYSVYSFHHK